MDKMIKIDVNSMLHQAEMEKDRLSNILKMIRVTREVLKNYDGRYLVQEDWEKIFIEISSLLDRDYTVKWKSPRELKFGIRVQGHHGHIFGEVASLEIGEVPKIATFDYRYANIKLDSQEKITKNIIEGIDKDCYDATVAVKEWNECADKVNALINRFCYPYCEYFRNRGGLL